MNDQLENYTAQYAIVVICLKRLLEDSKNVPITENLISIFWYSFTCFRKTNFEKSLSRAIDMIYAYIEFYRMTCHLDPGGTPFDDVVMFIIKSFPSTIQLDQCLEIQEHTLLKMTQVLIHTIIEKQDEYRKSPDMITNVSKHIYNTC